MAHDIHGGDVARHDQEVRYRGHWHQIFEIPDPGTEHYGNQHHSHVLLNLHHDPMSIQYLPKRSSILVVELDGKLLI